MPSQLANERTTDAMAGRTTNTHGEEQRTITIGRRRCGRCREPTDATPRGSLVGAPRGGLGDRGRVDDREVRTTHRHGVPAFRSTRTPPSTAASGCGSAREDGLRLALDGLAETRSTSFGFFRNSWIAGIMTVEAKSGRVSRSRNCAMFFASSPRLGRLLLQSPCSPSVRPRSSRRASYGSVAALTAPRLLAAQPREAARWRGRRPCRLRGLMKPSIGASSASADRRVDRREREEVDVV